MPTVNEFEEALMFAGVYAHSRVVEREGRIPSIDSTGMITAGRERIRVRLNLDQGSEVIVEETGGGALAASFRSQNTGQGQSIGSQSDMDDFIAEVVRHINFLRAFSQAPADTVPPVEEMLIEDDASQHPIILHTANGYSLEVHPDHFMVNGMRIEAETPDQAKIFLNRLNRLLSGAIPNESAPPEFQDVGPLTVYDHLLDDE